MKRQRWDRRADTKLFLREWPSAELGLKVEELAGAFILPFTHRSNQEKYQDIGQANQLGHDSPTSMASLHKIKHRPSEGYKVNAWA